jgi:methionyl aminopeptidase
MEADSSARTSIADINPPKSATATGLLHGSLDGEGEDGEDEDDNVGAAVKLDGEPVNGKSIGITISGQLTKNHRQKEKT